LARLAIGLHLPWQNSKPFHYLAERMKKIGKSKQAGFTMLEMLVVIGMSVIITAIAIPRYLIIAASLRASGDLRSVSGLLAQAKIRAAADFTHARVYADLSGNTYQLQVWDKAGNAGAGCWVADSDTKADSLKTCLTFGGGHPSGSLFTLAQGDSFGFNGLATGPTPGQPTPSQATGCLDSGGAGVGGNTACIIFNSRGRPIDAGGGPIPTGAFYLTNGAVVDGVTISATGSIQSWSSPANSANWYSQ
jgi:prepilin-type N-terminal cleavage/methylation domain-containing protein